jgi:hypothetical protein
VGRVKADGGDGGMEWVDHYSCSIRYPAADPSDPHSNFTLTFQNFNSLGLGPNSSGTKLGYPVRVTAGNADPIPKLGTPRMNTIWYSKIDESGLKPGDFDPPSRFCIPVGKEEAEAHFGHALNHASLRHDPSFRHRAHQLLTRTAQQSDLVRAKTMRPRKQYVGSNFAAARLTLNKHLLGTAGLKTRPCEEVSLDFVHEVQREIYKVRSPGLHALYRKGDGRQMPFASLEELLQNQKTERELLKGRPDLIPVVRDARCHEAVMWFTHHLTKHAREDFMHAQLVLPLLPKGDHSLRPQSEADADPAADQAHKTYNATISCAVCHTEQVAPSSPQQKAEVPSLLV